jgi:hypothetical protein
MTRKGNYDSVRESVLFQYFLMGSFDLEYGNFYWFLKIGIPSTRLINTKIPVFAPGLSGPFYWSKEGLFMHEHAARSTEI